MLIRVNECPDTAFGARLAAHLSKTMQHPAGRNPQVLIITRDKTHAKLAEESYRAADGWSSVEIIPDLSVAFLGRRVLVLALLNITDGLEGNQLGHTERVIRERVLCRLAPEGILLVCSEAPDMTIKLVNVPPQHAMTSHPLGT